MAYKPIRFISESIRVDFDKPPLLEKKPDCPDRFTWRGDTYHITRKLGEWFDYSRRGDMARNMTQAHTETAQRRGSWGVGRFFFRVETDTGQIFDLYYDRSPKNVNDRKGGWYLFQELSTSD